MFKTMISACVVLIVLTSSAQNAFPEPALSALDAMIAAEILRLGDPNPEIQTVAAKSLQNIGKPAVPALIKTLADPRESVRAQAAELLRTQLATDPSADPNSHTEAYWRERLSRVTVNMKLSDAVTLLELKPEQLKMTLKDGDSGSKIYRLDNSWMVRLSFTNRTEPSGERNNRINRIPEPKLDVQHIQVEIPLGFEGNWTTWYINGQKAQETEFHEGKRHGITAEFYEDGGKHTAQTYKSGVANGPSQGWWRNGKKMYDFPYRNGKRNGVCTRWHENGEIQSQTTYLYDKPRPSKAK